MNRYCWNSGGSDSANLNGVSNTSAYSPPNLVNATPGESPTSLLNLMDLSIAAAPVIPAAALTLIPLSKPMPTNRIATLIASFLDINLETISVSLLSIISPFSLKIMSVKRLII